jgi:hypothetical protein
LALSGGSVRALAHLGVVKALSEVGIIPSFIAGTSAGSLIGAMLAAGIEWSEIAALARKTFWPRLLHGQTLERFCAEHLPATFADLKLPFAAVTTELPMKVAMILITDGRACVRDQRQLRTTRPPAPGQTRREAAQRWRHCLRSALGSLPDHGRGLHHRLRCLGNQLFIARASASILIIPGQAVLTLRITTLLSVIPISSSIPEFLLRVMCPVRWQSSE